MLDVKDAEARAASLIETARKAGADAADVLYVGNGSTEVQVRLGDLEDVKRPAGEELGLRFFMGKRMASCSSPDLPAAAEWKSHDVGKAVDLAVNLCGPPVLNK